MKKILIPVLAAAAALALVFVAVANVFPDWTWNALSMKWLSSMTWLRLVVVALIIGIALLTVSAYRSPKVYRRWRIVLYIATGFVIVVLTYDTARAGYPEFVAHVEYRVIGSVQSAIMKVQGGDLLERRMHLLGTESLDCGRVRRQADPQLPSDCALRAFEGRKPFLVRFDLQGIDSDVAMGFVGTGDGRVTALLFDGDPSGAAGTSVLRQRVREQQCPSPVKLFKSARGYLNCFPPDPNARPSIMWPHW